mgnify:CR=1 FL=1
MIDRELLRTNPKIVSENLRKRGISEKPLQEWIALDSKWRKLKAESDSLRAERNSISKKISENKKRGEKIDKILEKARKIPEKLKETEEVMLNIDKERNKILMNMPNLLETSVPIGNALKNKVLEVKGLPSKKKARGHEEILIALDVLDIERATKVAGSRFYYLKNELVLLNQALINFALHELDKNGFILMQPPFMLRKQALESATSLSTFQEMIYKIENEDLYLIGTAEHALNAYYTNEVLNLISLPIRFAAISSCFRKEAGSHGKDTKGIFRIHQFEKVEQFVLCTPSQEKKEFNIILDNTKNLFKKLGIPFRTVLLASEETGLVSAKTVDIEGWFPAQKGYRELGSCSTVLDYQARRANIKYQEKGKLHYAYTLNNTAIATERMIVCLAENFQQKDGSIKIPKALWPYMNDKRYIRANKS